MSGYPHDMGRATEVWRKTIPFPGCGTIIILASFEEAHLDPKEQDEAQWIAQITFCIDMIDNQQQSRTSGYMYNKWFKVKEVAINELFRLLYQVGEMSVQTMDLKLL